MNVLPDADLGLPDLTHRPGRGGFLRPKGNLSRGALGILVILALLPLLSISLRVAALPGFSGPALDGLQTIGSALNEILSLTAVPADQRDYVLYLLLLPSCALLVAIARLTFGIRVLGFRSILISVGFHQSGIVPSLLLITVAVATIVLVRPWLRAIRLPYYGRVSVILCIVATTMLAALLAGPWMRADVLWGMAYFPVIVLGMLAEGIAGTLDRDNVVTASWRAVTTILLAFAMALICWIPALRSLMLEFPELVVTEIVAIVMVSEFLDLRLLQGWDAKVRARLLGSSPTDRSFRVAVVRNRIDSGALARDRHETREQALRSVQSIVDALRNGGYTVKVLEGDASLLQELRPLIPPHLGAGEPAGIVLNLAHGTRGAARTTHVPAMLEMSGVPYVGPTPLGHAATVDRLVAKVLLQQSGVPTPAFRLMAGPRDDAGGLRFPVVVGPRYEPIARPRVVQDRQQLRAAVKNIRQRHRQEAIVEERIRGRRISACLLHDAPLECLPLVEVDARTREKICPTRVEQALADTIRECAQEAFWACGCRDYARIDVCVGESGDVWVLRVQTLGILARRGAFVRAGVRAGYTFEQLVCRIIETARARYGSGEPLRPVRPRSPRVTLAGSSQAFARTRVTPP